MSTENTSLFNFVLDEALERLGKKNLKLKECHYEAVKAVVVDRKDTIWKLLIICFQLRSAYVLYVLFFFFYLNVAMMNISHESGEAAKSSWPI